MLVKGKNNRYLDHLKESKRFHNKISFKENKIRKIINEGYSLENFIVQLNFTEDEHKSLDNEHEIITNIGIMSNQTGPLTNQSYGGIGGINRIMSNEEKLSRSENHHMKGKTYEEIYGIEKAKELKEVRKNALIGHDCYNNPERSKKLSDNMINTLYVFDIRSNKNEKISKEEYEVNKKFYIHHNSKRIKCFDMNLNKIRNVPLNDLITNSSQYKLVKNKFNIYNDVGMLKYTCYSIKELQTLSIQLNLSKSTLTESLYQKKKITNKNRYNWYVVNNGIIYLDITYEMKRDFFIS